MLASDGGGRPAPERYSQDADSLISILDQTQMAQVFIQHVSAWP